MAVGNYTEFCFARVHSGGNLCPVFSRLCGAVHRGGLASCLGALAGRNPLCGAFANPEAHDIGFGIGCEGNRVRQFGPAARCSGVVAGLRGVQVQAAWGDLTDGHVLLEQAAHVPIPYSR